MIRPSGLRGAAFGTASDGDGRKDRDARSRIGRRLGIGDAWATISQVHGAVVATADAPRHLGEADAVITFRAGIPITVATADCLPIVVEGERSVAVIHAGWRGLRSGVIERTLETMDENGDAPLRAAIGPAIGPCCYEVGTEVADEFPGFRSQTTWGTESVDLPAAAAAALGGLTVWRSTRCTMTDAAFHSHRRDGTTARQVTVAWLPRT